MVMCVPALPKGWSYILRGHNYPLHFLNHPFAVVTSPLRSSSPFTYTPFSPTFLPSSGRGKHELKTSLCLVPYLLVSVTPKCIAEICCVSVNLYAPVRAVRENPAPRL